MTAKVDLTGQRFGRLLVVSMAGSDRFGKTTFSCLCDCGKTHITGSRSLLVGHSKSCGCYRDERRKTYRPPLNDKGVEDLSGRRFGYWTVLSLSDRRAAGNVALFQCVCDCGSESLVAGSRLKSGGSKSCGCYKKEAMANRRIKRSVSFVGQRFGRWTLLRYLGTVGAFNRFECQCDCGTVSAVNEQDLKNGSSSSCGCGRSETIFQVKSIDLTGQRSGKLVAVQVVPQRQKTKRSYVVWLCRCDCGNDKEVRAEVFSSGRIISCGCERHASRHGRTPYLSSRQRAKASARYNNRRALKIGAGGRFTAIQVSALYQAQRGRCVSCRGKLGDSYHRDHVVPLSLGGSNDISNIQLLCESCNLSKGAKDPIVWAQEQGRLI